MFGEGKGREEYCRELSLNCKKGWSFDRTGFETYAFKDSFGDYFVFPFVPPFQNRGTTLQQ